MNEQDFIGKAVYFISQDNYGSEIEQVGTIIGFEDYMTESSGYLVRIKCSDGNNYSEPLNSLFFIEEPK